MKKITLAVLVFLICGKVFPQSDSAFNFKTGYIFSVLIGNADSSTTEIKEMKIYSLTNASLQISSKEDSSEVMKVIDLKSIKKIGYQNGDYGWEYAGIGLVGTVVSYWLIDKLFKPKFKGDHSGGNPYLTGLIVLSVPVIAGVVGGVIGAHVQKYRNYELTRFNTDIMVKHKRVKMIINEGIKYHN